MRSVALPPTRYTADDLFGRHLDLAVLRGRRGKVHCIFHEPDRTPSLSVDLDRGVFHCFGCGEQGGLRRFASLVGEAHTPRAQVLPPESEVEEARHRLLRMALAQDARRAAWLPWWMANDVVRLNLNAARDARRWARVLGPDHPRTWPLLALAVRAETVALDAEAQLDAPLEEGRLLLDVPDDIEPIIAAAAGRTR
jgi:hypothetical protein